MVRWPTCVHLLPGIPPAQAKRELRECMRFGRSAHGDVTTYELTTRALWVWAWTQYGDDLLTKHINEMPGTRPLAFYVLGLVRPMKPREPVSADAPGVNVVMDDGTTQRFYDPAPPYFRCEARYLWETKVITREEYQRHTGTVWHREWCGGRLGCDLWQARLAIQSQAPMPGVRLEVGA